MSGTDRAWAAVSLTVGVIGGKAETLYPILILLGYNVDHVKALSAGGKDVPSNMRLRTIRDHKNP